MHSDKNNGFKVEKFVEKTLIGYDLQIEPTSQKDLENCYYDLIIWQKNKEIKIEIKSCNFIVNNGHRRKFYGRFDFTNPKSITKQRTNNVFICFVVCIGSEFEILGFLSARSLKEKFKAKRYLPLKEIMNLRLTRINKFCERILRSKNHSVTMSS